MDILQITVLVLIVVALVSSLPIFNKNIQSLITISCSVLVLLYIINEIFPVVEEIKGYVERLDFLGLDIIFKTVGIGLITQFVSDICLDNNNKALSNQMIFAGRIAIIITAMPVFLEVIDILKGLSL